MTTERDLEFVLMHLLRTKGIADPTARIGSGRIREELVSAAAAHWQSGVSAKKDVCETNQCRESWMALSFLIPMTNESNAALNSSLGKNKIGLVLFFTSVVK